MGAVRFLIYQVIWAMWIEFIYIGSGEKCFCSTCYLVGYEYCYCRLAAFSLMDSLCAPGEDFWAAL